MGQGQQAQPGSLAADPGRSLAGKREGPIAIFPAPPRHRRKHEGAPEPTDEARRKTHWPQRAPGPTAAPEKRLRWNT